VIELAKGQGSVGAGAVVQLAQAHDDIELGRPPSFEVAHSVAVAAPKQRNGHDQGPGKACTDQPQVLGHGRIGQTPDQESPDRIAEADGHHTEADGCAKYLASRWGSNHVVILRQADPQPVGGPRQAV